MPPSITATKVPTRIGSWNGSASSVSRPKINLASSGLSNIGITGQELEAPRIAGGKAGENRDDKDGGRGSPAPSMGEAFGSAARASSLSRSGSAGVQTLAT